MVPRHAAAACGSIIHRDYSSLVPSILNSACAHFIGSWTWNCTLLYKVGLYMQQIRNVWLCGDCTSFCRLQSDVCMETTWSGANLHSVKKKLEILKKQTTCRSWWLGIDCLQIRERLQARMGRFPHHTSNHGFNQTCLPKMSWSAQLSKTVNDVYFLQSRIFVYALYGSTFLVAVFIAKIMETTAQCALQFPEIY